MRVAKGVPFETMIFIRFTIPLLFMIPALAKRKVPFHFSRVRRHFWRAVFGLGTMYCFFYSLLHMPLMNALAFLNASPLFMPLIILLWLKLIVPKLRIAALVLGFIGVLAVLQPERSVGVFPSLIGLMGAFLGALAQIGVRQLSKSESTETILSYYFIIASFFSLFPMLYAWKPVEEPILWLYLVLIGIASWAYQYLFTLAVTHAPATKVGAANYLSVVFSGLLGWMFFGEIPSWEAIGGVALIITGGVLVVLSKKEPRSWSQG